MKLLMDEGGQIACEEHAPYRGSDTFVIGRWKPITQREWIEFAAETGREPACETCMAIARRAKESA